jgi:hypothetical protein
MWIPIEPRDAKLAFGVLVLHAMNLGSIWSPPQVLQHRCHGEAGEKESGDCRRSGSAASFKTGQQPGLRNTPFMRRLSHHPMAVSELANDMPLCVQLHATQVSHVHGWISH